MTFVIFYAECFRKIKRTRIDILANSISGIVFRKITEMTFDNNVISLYKDLRSQNDILTMEE